MSIIPTTYPVFQNNQVLTSANLNDSFTYLDMQNRLTRTNLIGIGIVCGFDVSVSGTEGAVSSITISEGTGVTSEGFLITSCPCATQFFRPYTPPQTPEYQFFQNLNLYELLVSRSIPTNDAEHALPLFPNPMVDYCVILLLEILDQDQKSCLGNSCDDIGVTRNFTVRKLLISKTDLDTLLTHYTNVPGLFPDKYTLPEIFMERPLFEIGHVYSYNEFSILYENAVRNSFYQLFGLAQSKGALAQSYDVYADLLAPFYDNQNPFGTSAMLAKIQLLSDYLDNQLTTGFSFLGMQYFFDFVKDLIAAYNEFKETAFRLATACCPSRDIFPFHLMLGTVAPSDPFPPTKYRHGFSQPRIYNEQKYLLEKSVFLHRKLVMMVDAFSVPLINNPDTSIPVKATPSREKMQKFSKRSVPYYYPLDASVPLTELERVWSYDAYIHSFKESPSSPYVVDVLSYYRNGLNGSAYTHRQAPLRFDMDAYNFFRIEGYIGKDCATALNQIRNLRDYFNLPFEVVALSLYSPLCGEYLTDRHGALGELEAEYAKIRKEVLAILRYAGYWFQDFFSETSDGQVLPTGVNRLSGELANMLPPDKLEQVKQRMQLMAEQKPSSIADSFTVSRDDTVSLWDINEDLLRTILPEQLSDFRFDAFPQTDGFFFWYSNFVLSAQDEIYFFRNWIYNLLSDETEDYSVEYYLSIFFHESDLLKVLNDLIYNYSYKQLQWVFENYKLRYPYFRDNDLAVFPNFIKKHPGVEHKAGVQPGGTFILLYEGERSTYSGTDSGIGVDLIFEGLGILATNQVFADLSLPYRVTTESLNVDFGYAQYDEADIPIYPDFSVPPIRNINQNFIKLEPSI